MILCMSQKYLGDNFVLLLVSIAMACQAGSFSYTQALS